MVSFIDTQRTLYGVKSICAQLPIAPSLYYEPKALEGGLRTPAAAVAGATAQ